MKKYRVCFVIGLQRVTVDQNLDWLTATEMADDWNFPDWFGIRGLDPPIFADVRLFVEEMQ